MCCRCFLPKHLLLLGGYIQPSTHLCSRLLFLFCLLRLFLQNKEESLLRKQEFLLHYQTVCLRYIGHFFREELFSICPQILPKYFHFYLQLSKLPCLDFLFLRLQKQCKPSSYPIEKPLHLPKQE